jgi:hypothetical protein
MRLALFIAILKFEDAAARHFPGASDRIRSVSNVPLAPQPVTPSGIPSLSIAPSDRLRPCLVKALRRGQIPVARQQWWLTASTKLVPVKGKGAPPAQRRVIVRFYFHLGAVC